MARITVEDCLEKIQNRFALIILASKRTKQLLTGSGLTIEDRRENKAVVNSLREISEGTVRFKTEEDLQREREKALQKREAELALAAEAESSNGSPHSEVGGSDVDDSEINQASTSGEAGESAASGEDDGEGESGAEQTLLVS